MTLPRFVVSAEALQGTVATLSGPEFHHLRVRRVRTGSKVILCDARGRQRQGIVLAIHQQEATIELREEVVPSGDSPLRLSLAQALLKGDKLDLVMEKATELGVTEVVLFTSERSIGQASAERVERWNRIARSAAKQCQRSTVPLVCGPVPFASLLCLPQNTAGLVFWEESSRDSTLASVARQSPRAVLVMVGPEGGFTPIEAAHAAKAGFQQVSLGPRILRAETAAIVAVTLCQFFWGDLSVPDVPRVEG